MAVNDWNTWGFGDGRWLRDVYGGPGSLDQQVEWELAMSGLEQEYDIATAGFESENQRASEALAEQRRQFDADSAQKQNFLQMLGIGSSQADPAAALQTGEFNEPPPLEQQNTLDDLFGGSSGTTSGFSDMINEQKDVTNQLLSNLEGYGDSQRARINQGFDTASNNAMANLERRGLGASNLFGATQAQVEGERGMAIGDLEDQLLGRRTDLQAGRSSELSGYRNAEMDRNLQRRQAGVGLVGNLGSSLFG